MKIEFDPKQNAKNIAKHGLSLELAADFNFSTAIYKIDNRSNHTAEQKSRNSKRKPLIDKDGEVREITAEDLKQFRSGQEVLPPEHWTILMNHMAQRRRGQRGPGKTPAKEHITLRLDPDIVSHYRASGPGWQKRINEDLRRVAKL